MRYGRKCFSVGYLDLRDPYSVYGYLGICLTLAEISSLGIMPVRYSLCKHGPVWQGIGRTCNGPCKDCKFAQSLRELEYADKASCYLPDQSGIKGGVCGVDRFFGQKYSAAQLVRLFSFIAHEYDSWQSRSQFPPWGGMLLWWHGILHPSMFSFMGDFGWPADVSRISCYLFHGKKVDEAYDLPPNKVFDVDKTGRSFPERMFVR